MTEAILFPDVEGVLVRHLPALVGVGVSTKVANPRPASFVRVKRVGGTKPNVITDSAVVVVECWAATEPEAERLSARANAYVLALAGQTVGGDFVRRVREVAGPASFPDPTSGSPRYQFTVQIDTRGVPL